jgi:hydroxyacylglutathione hydrolase
MSLMIHEVLIVGMLQVNCSVCGDEATREAFVIDPGEEAERILDAVEHHGLKVAGIVLTHAHIDHIGAVREVQEATGAPVSLHPADRALAENAGALAAMMGLLPPGHFDVDRELADGDVLRLGATEFRVLHTPGHTQGGCCLWIPAEGRLIAGDTLFRDSIGRTDLPGGNGPQLLESIRDKLFPLPDETVVIPGHGPQTTIGREREYNVFLQGL